MVLDQRYAISLKGTGTGASTLQFPHERLHSMLVRVLLSWLPKWAKAVQTLHIPVSCHFVSLVCVSFCMYFFGSCNYVDIVVKNITEQ